MAVVVELWESGKRAAFSKAACCRLFHNFSLDKNRQSLATLEMFKRPGGFQPVESVHLSQWADEREIGSRRENDLSKEGAFMA